MHFLRLPCRCNIPYFFQCSRFPSPSGNVSFIFSGSDTMKTAPCGAAYHTQQERPASLLGKVLYWIKQLLLFLNQYCKTIKGSGDGRHTKARSGGRRACRQLFMKAQFGLGQKKTSDRSGNNRTFRKSTSHPASQLLALGPVSLSDELPVSLCFLMD